jgi:MGT family glycosyltransferase
MSQKTVAFFPEPGAWGPTNNLVAIAEVLRDRGVRCVFVIEESFQGELTKRGFEEAAMRLSSAPEQPEAVGEGWAEFIRETAPEFRKPTIEQLATVIRPIWQELVGGGLYAHDRLMKIWSEIRPDVIVSDNVVGFAAVPLAGVPWVRMVSANPLEMEDPALPPVFSGFPSDDRSQWVAFQAEYRRLHDPLIEELSAFNVSVGAEPLPAGHFQYDSPFANLYLFPEVMDYQRTEPLDQTWHRLDSTVRVGEDPFDLDAVLPGDGKVIYLSMGSLGCNDLGLMQRLIDAFDRTPHRVVVSMGPLHEQMRLGERMWGAEFLPQPSILPQADLLVTHGGNNTVTEGFNFGLPMIVLPLFWDQYDNAQRVHELGFGRRLDTYGSSADEIAGAANELLTDAELKQRMKAISKSLRSTPAQAKAADLVMNLFDK